MALLASLLAVDLWSFGVGFNPASATSASGLRSARRWHSCAPSPAPSASPRWVQRRCCPANLAMRAGLEDIRGYDTIIKRDYVDYLNLIERPGALLYSKVEKLFDERSLSSPLFHALNVGYVLSERPINLPGYELVFTEAVNVYRDTRALPRAFIVSDARFVSSPEDALTELRRVDPSRTVVIEGFRPQSRQPAEPAT